MCATLITLPEEKEGMLKHHFIKDSEFAGRL
jgi:hypothetical protein